jgi:hypothetical protein
MNRRDRRAAAAGARRGPSRVEAPPPSPATELHNRVAEAERKRAGEILSTAIRSPGALFEAVDDAVALADSVQERNPTRPSALACKRGCNHCCHLPVSTLAPTVLRIAAALRALDPADFEEALGRVVALDEQTHGLPWSPSQRLPLPCALLVDGACMAYSVRPFVCRGWNSVDADACRRLLIEGGVDLRYDSYQRATFSGVDEGLRAAIRAQGLDTTELELTAALRVALETQDACERWLAGERVFAGCEARRIPNNPKNRLPMAR